MAFCASCGSPVEGRFCAKCGAVVGSATPVAQASPAGVGVQPVVAQGGLSENAASALCYVLGLITGILFLVIAPYSQNRAVRFHAFQSIFMNVAWIGVWIVETVISVILWRISFALYSALALLFTLVGLAFFVLWIFMIVKAYQGQKVMLPVIGALAEKQA
jgi:uncharacterized membrane protein